MDRLIFLGYPEQLKQFQYEANFGIRGLWFDQIYGNLLKVDGFGNILVGVHGYDYILRSDIRKQYPSKFLSLKDPDRVLVMNSLFEMAHTFVLATTVHYFDNHHGYTRAADGTGVQSGDTIISYKSLSQDVASAVSYVHNDNESKLKSEVLCNIDKYIIKDVRIKKMLRQLQSHGSKTFLLTNSAYNYTNGIMRYLIGDDWTSYFDVAIVDAKKPLWFAQGTVFRQVDTVNGTPKIGVHQGPLKKGDVYAGGNSEDFRRLFNARDRDVLYTGDHIFGDVLKSKKTKGWRTFLIIPELAKEISIWARRHEYFEKLVDLSEKMEKLYNQLDMESEHALKPDIQKNLKEIRETTQEMDKSYSKMGSLFRSGPRTTFFATQVGRFADLYSSSCYNLIYYPQFYFFRAAMTLMPHEMSVDNCLLRNIHVQPTVSTELVSTPIASGSESKTVLPHLHEENEEATVSDELNSENSENSDSEK